MSTQLQLQLLFVMLAPKLRAAFQAVYCFIFALAIAAICAGEITADRQGYLPDRRVGGATR